MRQQHGDADGRAGPRRPRLRRRPRPPRRARPPKPRVRRSRRALRLRQRRRPLVPTVPTGYTELDKALGSDQPFKGKKVDIQVQWTGGELANFQASLADFAKATGITIQVDSVPSSHETVLKSRIEGGSPPDIAQLAQPTPVLAYAAEGKVIDVATFMDPTKLKHGASGDHRPRHPGRARSGASRTRPTSSRSSGIRSRRSPPRVTRFPRRGTDLIALSDKIVADGSNPWCVSAGGPGDATGWQITDWVEEVVLKTKGLQYYNDWISHKVTFEDPGIKAAFDHLRRQDLLHPQLRLRRPAGDHQHRPEDHHGSDVQPGPGRPEVLDAEGPDLVRARLLPGSAGQRTAVQVRRRHRCRHHAVPDDRSRPEQCRGLG